jgi:antitoxin component YwqK of YwqJK toxin-antitoxin module
MKRLSSRFKICLLLICSCKEVQTQKENYITSLDSIKVSYHKNGVLKETSSIKDGLLNGKLFHFDKDGYKRAEQNFLNGKLEGEQYVYILGRLSSIENYSNSLKNGKATYYDLECGFVYEEGFYKNDLRDGPWFSYQKNELLQAELYKSDTLVRVIYENTRLIRMINEGNINPGCD